MSFSLDNVLKRDIAESWLTIVRRVASVITKVEALFTECRSVPVLGLTLTVTPTLDSHFTYSCPFPYLRGTHWLWVHFRKICHCVMNPIMLCEPHSFPDF